MRTYEKRTRIPDTNEPVKKPRPSALRYPLPSEIAEGELLQSGVDTLQTRADLDRNEHGRSKALSFAMRKRAPEMSQPVKKAPPSVRTSYPIQKTDSTDVEKVQSVVDTFQAKAVWTETKEFGQRPFHWQCANASRKWPIAKMYSKGSRKGRMLGRGTTNDTATNGFLGLGRITSCCTTRCGCRIPAIVSVMKVWKRVTK